MTDDQGFLAKAHAADKEAAACKDAYTRASWHRIAARYRELAQKQDGYPPPPVPAHPNSAATT